MSTGADKSRQFSIPGDGDKSGGNSSGGKSPASINPQMVPDFQGKSGKPDNQNTNRPHGST